MSNALARLRAWSKSFKKFEICQANNQEEKICFVNITHHSCGCRKLAEEVQASKLSCTSSDDIPQSRVPNMSNRGDDWCGASSPHIPQVMRHSEHRPVIADRPKVGISCIREPSIFNEVCTDCNICTILPSYSRALAGE